MARIAGIPVNARWMREMLVHDTREDLARIHVPVLAVTGDNDLQVDPADLEVVRRLVPGRAETVRVPGLTHLLRVDNEQHSIRAYRRLLRQPVDVALLDLIADWLHHELRGHASPGAARQQREVEGQRFDLDGRVVLGVDLSQPGDVVPDLDVSQ